MKMRQASVLRRLAVVAVLSVVAAACGGDDSASSDTTAVSGATPGSDTVAPNGTTAPDSETTAPTTGSTAPTDATTALSTAELPDDLDPEGVLKFGERLASSGGVHFDPTTMAAPTPNNIWMPLVYGTLMREAEDGSVEPWMAEDVEIVDPQTVVLSLRDGVTFTDGAPYDAEAVKTSLLRTLNEAGDRQKAGQPSAFKAIQQIDVVDAVTVRITLAEPVASELLRAFARDWGTIQSPKQIAENPTQIDTNPVGAGPFTFVELVPEQVLSLKKNPDFWDADKWLLGGIDIVNTPYGPTQVNGLLAGAVDFAPVVPIDSVAAVQGDKKFGTTVVPGVYTGISICTGKPPFDSDAVRQAMNIAIDRDQYNELVYGGLATPAYGFFPEGHPLYEPETESILAHDVDKAKQILADAGIESVDAKLFYGASVNYQRNAEVIQAQLAEVGINLEVVASQDLTVDFVQPQSPGLMMAPLPSPYGYEYFARTFSEGGAWAYCGTQAPEIVELAKQAAALPADDPQVAELYSQAQILAAKSGLFIPLVFEPTVAGWDTSRVGGEPSFDLSEGRPRLRFESVYIKK